MAIDNNHFRYNIGQNSADSQQAQPWALMLVVHFKFPNTLDLPSEELAFVPLNDKGNSNNSLFSDDNAVKYEKLLIRSDILDMNVQSTKGSAVGSASVTLTPGSYEYDKAVTPGDHVFLWMGNDLEQLRLVSEAINNQRPANFFQSGLKFYGRIESVRKIFNADETGMKTIRYNINMKSFSELNSQVYFNPYLRNKDDNESYLFYAQLSKSYSDLFSKGGTFNPQEAVKFFLDIFLGPGPGDRATGTETAKRSPANAYMVPRAIGEIFGQLSTSKGTKITYADILNAIIGVQNYAKSKPQFVNEDATYQGFLPQISDTTVKSRHRECTDKLKGVLSSLPDLFNNTSLYSIISSVVMNNLNEMYTALRTDELGNIYPTLVVRQIPFTTDRFFKAVKQSDATRFLSLPRWVVDKSLRIGDYNIGTSDVMRVNFVHFFGALFGQAEAGASAIASQSSNLNFKEDRLDILRSGGRNMVVISNTLISQKDGSVVPDEAAKYATLVADWYMNGHLKLTGNLSTVGITEPICVGDNLEFDGTVFHIEGVSHRYAMEGINKIFRTEFSLVNGIRVDGAYAYVANELDRGRGEQYGYTAEFSGDKVDKKETSIVRDAVDGLLNLPQIKDIRNKFGIG